MKKRILIFFIGTFAIGLMVLSCSHILSGKRTISAGEFWDYYFRSEFIHLKRYPDRYEGVIVVLNRKHHVSLLDALHAKERKLVVSTASLRTFDYASESRFSYVTDIPKWDIAKAYSAIENETYPYRTPPPRTTEHMAELFKEIRSAYRLENDDITLSKLQSILLDLVVAYTPPSSAPRLNALAWFLGERRDRTSGEVLTAIIANSVYVGGELSDETAKKALGALEKVNAKLQLPALVELMEKANHSGRVNIAKLLSRLLSTDERLSITSLGENWRDLEQPHYWKSIIAQAEAKTQADWDRYDINSLYWEYRYMAALHLPREDVESLNQLKEDVVTVVADAAKSR